MPARVFSWLLIVVFAAPVVAAAAPEDSGNALDLPTLRARIVAAHGKLPSRERVTEAYTRGGLSGKVVTTRDGNDSRIDNSYGPLMSARGEFHGQAWHQNENGETVLEQPEPGVATREATTTTVTRVTTPLDAWVIATLNAAKAGTKEYLDPKTYRILRFERVGPTGTTVTSYDDFRSVDGYTRAWHWTVRDGHSEDDADYRIGSDDVAIAAPNLAIPDSRGEFVEFPAGETSVALPVREERGKFIVRVQVGTRGLDLILDTGAAGIVLDDDVVRTLGLRHYGSFGNAANAGRYLQTRAIVPEMSVGDLRMHDVVVSSAPHLGDEGSDYKAVGLLGFDFIGAVALAIDYEHGTVTATEPDAFAPPKASPTFTIPVRLGSQTPLTDVTLGGALGERFLIDTGGGGTMLVFDYFARRHPEALTGALSAYGEPTFRGVGGNFATRPYRIGAVRLGNLNFKDFTVFRVMSANAYSGSEDGVIGVGFLELFTLYTDYGNSVLYLVPNAAGRASRLESTSMTR